MSDPKLTRIEVHKDYLKFSAAHFTLFSASARENLHGHDFRVRCTVTAAVGEDGLAFDYGILKQALAALCAELDERVLLPLHSPYLRVEVEDGWVSAHFAAERIPFLARDVLLLPVRNVTAEELAGLLLERLQARPEISALKLQSIALGVSSGRGQWAFAHWGIT
ncbi:6-pyruvoyl trahydropterin synthase family protein [Caldichromatium japonicum]|uniref:6-pyruvoyl trahydropterin synthase family protein n=1 Tax=Caldichromatium japonicum TaxID=2699430 RepID=UPI001FEC5993|nr:6-carboxytetrahydropterin synthase [Caldichromatium japonicum]